MLEGLHLAWTSLPSRSGVWQTEPTDRVYQSSLPIEYYRSRMQTEPAHFRPTHFPIFVHTY